MFDMTYRAHVPPRAILVNGPLARISVTIEMADAGDLEPEVMGTVRLDEKMVEDSLRALGKLNVS